MGVYDNWVIRVTKGDIAPDVEKAKLACKLLGISTDLGFLLQFEDIRRL
jgi:hypothetical protein